MDADDGTTSRGQGVTFAFLLKTYDEDVEYVTRLLDSYHRHNRERLPLVISCPRKDLLVFTAFAGDTVSVIADEDVTDELVDEEVAGIRPGYVNQEIVKLAFWETCIAENYMCLDSDGLFLRDFALADFMYDEQTPFTVMFEDNELRIDRDYYETHWVTRWEAIDRIREAVGLPPQPLITCHGFGIFSSRVLRSLRWNFMAPRGLGYADLIAISPYEFSWYTLYAQASSVIPIHPRESLFRYVHSPRQQYLLALFGVGADDLARGYVGVTVNSNYSRDYGIASTSDPVHVTLGRYVSFRDLGRAIGTRAVAGARIIFRRITTRQVGR